MSDIESPATERDAVSYYTEEDDSEMESMVVKSAWLISDDEERSSDDRKRPDKTGNGPEKTVKRMARPETVKKKSSSR